MAVDFGDPETWDRPLSTVDALNLGIWALNTLQHPDASTDDQFVVADHFSERAVEILDRLRERLEDDVLISLRFTSDDVASMAENADVPYDIALERADEWAKHVGETASTLINEQMASIVKHNTP